MNQDDIFKANRLYDENFIDELYKFIKPMIEVEDPYALYLSSCFSLEEWNESEDEYDKRYIESLTKAAEGNVPEALYRLSTLYSVGDIVELNIEKGKLYMESALKSGYSPAKLSLGLYLYHGANGYDKDRERALELITEAENDKVEGASEFLKNCNES